MDNTLEQFYKLTTAEEYLAFFEIAYDQAVVHVNRLHILKKFSQLRNEIEATLPANISEDDRLEKYGNAMHEAYTTFLSSNGVKEKLFKVFHDQQQAVSFVSFSDIKKG